MSRKANVMVEFIPPKRICASPNCQYLYSFLSGTSGRELPANTRDVGDAGSIPRLGEFPEGGRGNPLQYS